VLVQNLESRLYLAPKGGWVKLNQRPLVFANAVEAISFCIHRSVRMIRLVSNGGCQGKESYLYPFGDDPLVKAERKKLSKLLAESRRLKQQKRILMARMDILHAETKERRKEVPFKRRPLAGD